MTQRTSTDFIAVHCSATKPTLDVTEAMIRTWHLDQGWADVGYNVVIRRNGLIEMGRHPDAQGAHVAGFNRNSVGVCLAGGLTVDGSTIDADVTPGVLYTPDQLQSLLITLRFLKAYAPQARIQGHRDFPDMRKACPCFDVRAWLMVEAPNLL